MPNTPAGFLRHQHMKYKQTDLQSLSEMSKTNTRTYIESIDAVAQQNEGNVQNFLKGNDSNEGTSHQDADNESRRLCKRPSGLHDEANNILNINMLKLRIECDFSNCWPFCA